VLTFRQFRELENGEIAIIRLKGSKRQNIWPISYSESGGLPWT